MKKMILLTALLVSVVCGKSMEQIQSEWREKYSAMFQKQGETFWQSAEAQRLLPHCQSGDKDACRKIIDLQDKYCQNGFASSCGVLAQTYLQGDEQFDIKINKNKAKEYANRICTLDGVICANMALSFNKNHNDKTLALQYAEKACEMGEMVGCFTAGLIYNTDEGGIGKNPQKVKYYESKLCKAGVEDFCK